MYFEEDAIYHIYNRSNEVVFLTRENYLFFVDKLKDHLAPYCNLLAWCLMPNHFHLMLQATSKSVQYIEDKHRPNVQQLPIKIGLIVSSYTQAFNKLYGRRGSLFAHKAKSKMLNDDLLTGIDSYNQLDYATTCFLYIHQNPVMAGLANYPGDWEFSSFRDYAGLRNGSLINNEIGFQIVNLDSQEIIGQSMMYLDETLLKKLF